MRRLSMTFLLPLLLGIVAQAAFAQSPATSPAPLPSLLEMNLWPGDPPGMVQGAGPGADDGTGRYRNVGIPGMLVYLPPNGGIRRPAIIVCPGGAYTHLTGLAGGDGTVAEFCPKGVVIVALKYRLNPPSKQVEADSLADAKRAVRLVRSHAKDWKIDPNKVGVLGWSAGANLALNLATHSDRGDPKAADNVERQSSRPDYIVLLSPWPDDKTLAAYPIGKDTPPAFIGSARDDKTAPPAFAMAILDAYQHLTVSSELILVETGGHAAFEPTSTGEGSQWPNHFWPWLLSKGMGP